MPLLAGARLYPVWGLIVTARSPGWSPVPLRLLGAWLLAIAPGLLSLTFALLLAIAPRLLPLTFALLLAPALLPTLLLLRPAALLPSVTCRRRGRWCILSRAATALLGLFAANVVMGRSLMPSLPPPVTASALSLPATPLALLRALLGGGFPALSLLLPSAFALSILTWPPAPARSPPGSRFAFSSRSAVRTGLLTRVVVVQCACSPLATTPDGLQLDAANQIEPSWPHECMFSERRLRAVGTKPIVRPTITQDPGLRSTEAEASSPIAIWTSPNNRSGRVCGAIAGST